MHPLVKKTTEKITPNVQEVFDKIENKKTFHKGCQSMIKLPEHVNLGDLKIGKMFKYCL